MDEQGRYEMEMSFSRGFSPGWLNGCDHKMLVPALSSAKRGVLAGVVTRIEGQRVSLDVHCSLAAGDGIVFEGDRNQGEEQGGRIYEVFVDGKRIVGAVENGQAALAFGKGCIDPEKIEVGLKVWKTDDPKLNQRLRKSYNVADPVRRGGVRSKHRMRCGEANPDYWSSRQWGDV